MLETLAGAQGLDCGKLGRGICGGQGAWVGELGLILQLFSILLGVLPFYDSMDFNVCNHPP